MRPREALLAALDSASTDSGRLCLVTVPLAPSTRPLDVWAAFPTSAAMYWDTAEESAAGIGTCLRSDGPDASRRALERLATAVRVVAPGSDGWPAPAPRLMGALPFAADWTDDWWRPLTEHGFVLPRWTVFRSAAGAALQLAVEGQPEAALRAAIAEELELIESALRADGSAPEPWPSPGTATTPAKQDAARWRGAVNAAVAEITAGRMEKVVLSRYVVHEFPSIVDAATLLRRLRDTGAGRYRYGIRRGGTAFVGASPECLFHKRGARVELEALAGTYDLGSEPSSDSLLDATEHLFGSGKDLEEHALVVSGIVAALEPISDSVSAADWPAVRTAAGGLAHLSSVLRARVRPSVSALDLVAALHPTPAVGGLPADVALQFIRSAEPEPRGLFAAPVGWIDADGDACVAVAIRSALLRGQEARVYAGAGIVAGSEPEAEWRETEAKLRWLADLAPEPGDS